MIINFSLLIFFFLKSVFVYNEISERYFCHCLRLKCSLSSLSVIDCLAFIYLLVCLHYELFIAPSPYGSVRTRSKWLTDRKRMRRILSFHGFFLILRFTWSWIYFGFYLRLYGADCPLHKKSVYSPQCNKNPYKSTRHKGAIPKIKNQ